VTSEYRYDLPPELIAKAPAEPADASRLMLLGASGTFEHRTFVDLPSLLQPGDLLVINETRVIRARLRGRRAGGGAAEVLLLRPLDRSPYDPQAREWEALVRPGRRLRAGSRVTFGDAGACEVVDVASDGIRHIRFDQTVSLPELLERHGEMPLPKYVGPGDEARAARYQTMFARVPGSIAAPTASLHFTPRVVETLQRRGVEIAPLALDVGYGTFKPIEAERIADHVMHAERYAIPAATAAAIETAKRQGRRVVAAGTTVLRALESAARESGTVRAGEAETALFITPGFEFRVADVLLTNFHLPASSLLVLVAAFAGYERIMHAYALATSERYRFYSFGDAMLIERITGH
jgi:S-adenosylmethionine:tRNA ribosyltransferase-isomerase